MLSLLASFFLTTPSLPRNALIYTLTCFSILLITSISNYETRRRSHLTRAHHVLANLEVLSGGLTCLDLVISHLHFHFHFSFPSICASHCSYTANFVLLSLPMYHPRFETCTFLLLNTRSVHEAKSSGSYFNSKVSDLVQIVLVPLFLARRYFYAQVAVLHGFRKEYTKRVNANTWCC